MKNVWMTIFLMGVICVPAQAETIVLKTGTVITGSIIEKDPKKIKVDVSGVGLTYYLDDIKSINGVEPTNAATPIPKNVTPTVEAPKPTTPKPATPKPTVVPTPAVESKIQPKADLAASGMSKKELILKFIDLFGTKESLKRNLGELVKRSPPQQAEAFQKAVNVDELIEELVPIYDRYFSEADLRAFIEFYSSPEGTKLLNTVPRIMEDSVGVSMKYFKEKLPQAGIK